MNLSDELTLNRYLARLRERHPLLYPQAERKWYEAEPQHMDQDPEHIEMRLLKMAFIYGYIEGRKEAIR